MKISIIKIVLIGTFLTSLLTGFDSNAQQAPASKENSREEKKNIKEAKKAAEQEELQATEKEEYQTFMKESAEKIQSNESKIKELKESKKEEAIAADQDYEKRINNLQEKNEEMKMRMKNYQPKKSTWVQFKEEFNLDISELGNAFKDIAVNNRK